MVLSPQQADQSYDPGSDAYEACLGVGRSADWLVLGSIRIVDLVLAERSLFRRRHSVIMGAGDHPEEKDKKKDSMMLRCRMPAGWDQMLM